MVTSSIFSLDLEPPEMQTHNTLSQTGMTKDWQCTVQCSKDPPLCAPGSHITWAAIEAAQFHADHLHVMPFSQTLIVSTTVKTGESYGLH